MTKGLKYIILAFCAALFAVQPAQASRPAAHGADGKLDVRQLVLDHLGDEYQWDIAFLGPTHVIVPLPVIVKSAESGWHFFMSSRLEKGETYNGFYIAAEGEYEGKIVERNSAGEEVRPLDLSLTKIASALLFNSLLLIALILGVARWYRRHSVENGVPKGFVGFMEMFVMMVHDDLIKSCIGKDYKRYAPYLLTVFFFIFINNIMGLIPIFPGGANVTGSISVTMVLALCTLLAVNVFGTREYWREIFWPDVPTWLKVPIPMMPLIELVGIITKPFALMIRLFANMLAGHAVILSLTCLVFVTVSMGPAINGSMTVLSVVFLMFMNVLELLVAFIQAYVFTMLSAVFIGLSRVQPHHGGADISRKRCAPPAVETKELKN